MAVVHPVVNSEGGYGKITSTITKTSTYIDICPTGLITKTFTWTKTCHECEKENVWASTTIESVWTTTVTVCTVCGAKPTTITLTKPCSTPASAIAQPSSTPSTEWRAPDYQAGKPDSKSEAKPAGTSTLVQVVYVSPVPASEYHAAAALAAMPTGSGPVASAPASYGALAMPGNQQAGVQSSAAGAYAASSAATTATGSPAQFTGAAGRVQVGAGVIAAGVVAVLAF